MDKILEKLSDEERKTYEDLFKKYSENGEMRSKELRKMMAFYGFNASETELLNAINEIDSTGNGCIKFNDFLTVLFRSLKTSEAEEELREAFRVFDRNGDGFISAFELRNAMNLVKEKVRKEEINAMIKEALWITEGDVQSHEDSALINYEEFILVLTSKFTFK